MSSISMAAIKVDLGRSVPVLNNVNAFTHIQGIYEFSDAGCGMRAYLATSLITSALGMKTATMHDKISIDVTRIGGSYYCPGTEFGYHFGGGFYRQTIGGSGGTETLSNGATNADFTVPSTSVTATVLEINGGGTYTINNQFYVDLLLSITQLMGDERQASFVLSIGMIL